MFYTLLIVLLHTRERLLFSLFSKRIPASKKSRERVCNSTISKGEGGKNQLSLLMNYIIDYDYCQSIRSCLTSCLTFVSFFTTVIYQILAV